jgi:hypothetical protein
VFACLDDEKSTSLNSEVADKLDTRGLSKTHPIWLRGWYYWVLDESYDAGPRLTLEVRWNHACYAYTSIPRTVS